MSYIPIKKWIAEQSRNDANHLRSTAGQSFTYASPSTSRRSKGDVSYLPRAKGLAPCGGSTLKLGALGR